MEGTQLETYQDASHDYVGRWNRLVSTTNWEKGKIILQWREALVAADAASGDYSDEAWSRRVRNVSPSHAGRLRRVAERFAEVRETYEGLYWSHFHAALDWDDAEMWLEGALQSDWSVSQMKQQRTKALGGPEEHRPRPEEVLVGKLGGPLDPGLDHRISPMVDVVWDPGGESGWKRDEDDPQGSGPWASRAASRSDLPGEVGFKQMAEWAGRFLDDLPRLPEDLAAAVEGLRLAIVRHKLAQWQEASRDDVLGALDALKGMALAP